MAVWTAKRLGGERGGGGGEGEGGGVREGVAPAAAAAREEGTEEAVGVAKRLVQELGKQQVNEVSVYTCTFTIMM